MAISGEQLRQFAADSTGSTCDNNSHSLDFIAQVGLVILLPGGRYDFKDTSCGFKQSYTLKPYRQLVFEAIENLYRNNFTGRVLLLKFWEIDAEVLVVVAINDFCFYRGVQLLQVRDHAGYRIGSAADAYFDNIVVAMSGWVIALPKKLDIRFIAHLRNMESMRSSKFISSGQYHRVL